MSSSPQTPRQAEAFGVWLRRESRRALKFSAAFLGLGLVGVFVLNAAWPGFASVWRRANYQLTRTALEQHPLALARTFGARLGSSEYGWGLFSWTAPFNVTAAREELRHEFPEFIGVRDGVPVRQRRAGVRRAGPDDVVRAAAYLERLDAIESRRFTRLYRSDDLFSPPDTNAELGRVITKLLGLPDAAFHVVRSIIAGGIVSILLFSTVLAFSGAALVQAHRPARRWLKLLVWPTLASCLVWIAILVMSLASAFFGGLTPDTSALALLTFAPFLLICAKAPSRFAEGLVLKPVAPKWDGIDRRKNRAPAPPPGQTTPPVGGA